MAELTGTISGRVVDRATDGVIPFATVSARQGATLSSAETDMDGAYRIPNLPGGSYTVEAVAQGYLSRSAIDVPVQIGRAVTCDLKLDLKPLGSL